MNKLGKFALYSILGVALFSIAIVGIFIYQQHLVNASLINNQTSLSGGIGYSGTIAIQNISNFNCDSPVSCDGYFDIYNKLSVIIFGNKTVNLNLSKMNSYNFSLSNMIGKVSKFNVYELENISTINILPTYNLTNITYYINQTNSSNFTLPSSCYSINTSYYKCPMQMQNGTINQTVYSMQYVPILNGKNNFTLNQGHNYFKVIGNVEPNSRNYFNIPFTTGYGNLNIDPWWNSSWQYCRNIPLTESNYVNRINEPVTFNLTGLTMSNASKEIRIVNTSCNLGGSDVARDILSSDDSTWAVARFEVNITKGATENYSVYYDNPSATVPSYNPDPNLFWNNTQIKNSIFTFNLNSYNGSFSSGYISAYSSTTNICQSTDGNWGDCSMTAVWMPGSSNGWYATGDNFAVNNFTITTISNGNVCKDFYINGTLGISGGGYMFGLNREYIVCANNPTVYQKLSYKTYSNSSIGYGALDNSYANQEIAQSTFFNESGNSLYNFTIDATSVSLTGNVNGTLGTFYDSGLIRITSIPEYSIFDNTNTSVFRLINTSGYKGSDVLPWNSGSPGTSGDNIWNTYNFTDYYGYGTFANNFSLVQNNFYSTKYPIVVGTLGSQQSQASSNLQVTLNSPTDNYKTTSANITFNGTATQYGTYSISNISIFTNITGSWTINQTNTSVYNNTATIFNITGIPNGVYLWNYQACDSSGVCNFSSSNRTITIYTPPTITFLNQTPSNINTLNLYSNGLYINYSVINGTYSLNTSNITLYYKTNTSTDNTQFYSNGTAYSGYFQATGTNQSSNWTFSFSDDDVFPGTWNLNQSVFSNTPHSNITLIKAGAVKVNLFNVSNLTSYNIFQYMVNSSASALPLHIYYCNSTYVSGDLSKGNVNCVEFASLSQTQTFNITEPQLNQSKYQYSALFINTTTGLAENLVRVTPTSSIVMFNPDGQSWYIYNVANLSRPNASQYSVKNGATWTNESYTIDAHLQQFDGHVFYYYACASDINGNVVCSPVRSDTISLSEVPPSTPQILIPLNTTYNGVINITYNPSISPYGANITGYNITLLNPDGTFNKTIINNNYPNTNYSWNTASVPDGGYMIKVVATDNNSLTSFDITDIFTIDNTPPITYLISPSNNSGIVGLNLTANFTANETDNYNLSNATIYIWNSTGSQINLNSTNITGTSNQTNWSYTLPNTGKYYWNVYSCDAVGNCAFNSTNNSFTISFLSIPINLTSPSNNYISPNNYITTNGTATFNTLNSPSNVSIFTNITGSWVINQTNSTPVNNTATIFNLTNIPDGTYLWSYQACDNSSFCNFSSNRTFTIDTHASSISFTTGTPSNNSNLSQTYIFANVTYSTLNFANVTFNIYNQTSLVNSTTYSTFIYSINWTNLPNAFYYINATISDLLDNQNSTGTYRIMLDTQAPSANLISPTNNSILNSSTITINSSASDNMALRNVSLYINNTLNQTNSSGINNTNYIFPLSFIDGLWKVMIQACDWVGLCTNSSTNSFTIDTHASNISYTTGTPSNNSYLSQNYIFVNVTTSPLNFANISFVLSNLSGVINNTIYSVWSLGNNTINFTNLANGEYWFNVSIADLLDNINSTPTQNIYLDTQAPNITLNSPTNNEILTNNLTTFNATVSDNIAISNVSLYINNTLNQTNSSGFNNTNYIFNQTLNDGWWNYTINSCDKAGNCVNSSTYTFAVVSHYPNINYLTITTSNNSNLSQNWLYLSVNTSTMFFSNITYYLYNSTSIVNSTTYNTNITSINFTNLNNSYYWFNVSIADIADQINSTPTYKSTLDIISFYNSAASPNPAQPNSNVTFSSNVSDNFVNISNVSLYINNILNDTNISGLNNVVYNFVKQFSVGLYNWFFKACDTLGICTNSQTQQEIINLNDNTYQFEVDSNHTSVVNDTFPNINWSYNVFNQWNTSYIQDSYNILTVNNVVYGVNGTWLYALNLNNGSEIWGFNSTANWVSPLGGNTYAGGLAYDTVSSDGIIFACNPNANILYAIYSNNGSQMWNQSITCNMAPVIYNNTIYTAHTGGTSTPISSYYESNGSKIFDFNMNSSYTDLFSPSVINLNNQTYLVSGVDGVFGGAGSYDFWVWNATNGSVVCAFFNNYGNSYSESRRGSGSWNANAQLYYTGGSVIGAGSTGSGLRAINITTCANPWTYNLDSTGNAVQNSPATYNNIVVYGIADSPSVYTLVGLNASNGATNWSDTISGVAIGTPTISQDGIVFFEDNNSNAYFINITNGNILKQINLYNNVNIPTMNSIGQNGLYGFTPVVQNNTVIFPALTQTVAYKILSVNTDISPLCYNDGVTITCANNTFTETHINTTENLFIQNAIFYGQTYDVGGWFNASGSTINGDYVEGDSGIQSNNATFISLDTNTYPNLILNASLSFANLNLTDMNMSGNAHGNTSSAPTIYIYAGAPSTINQSIINVSTIPTTNSQGMTVELHYNNVTIQDSTIDSHGNTWNCPGLVNRDCSAVEGVYGYTKLIDGTTTFIGNNNIIDTNGGSGTATQCASGYYISAYGNDGIFIMYGNVSGNFTLYQNGGNAADCSNLAPAVVGGSSFTYIYGNLNMSGVIYHTAGSGVLGATTGQSGIIDTGNNYLILSNGNITDNTALSGGVSATYSLNEFTLNNFTYQYVSGGTYSLGLSDLARVGFWGNSTSPNFGSPYGDVFGHFIVGNTTSYLSGLGSNYELRTAPNTYYGPLTKFNSLPNNSIVGLNAYFNISALDTYGLKNSTIYIWYQNGTFLASNSTNISGTSDTYTIPYSFAHTGNYTINLLTYNINNLSDDFLNNNISIETEKLPPNVTYISPANNSYSNNQSQSFIAYITDDVGITNVSIYLDGVLNQTITTALNNINYVFNISGIIEGVHHWFVQACNVFGLCTSGSNQTLNIDTTPPNSYLISPSNNTQTFNTTINFTANEVDNMNLSNATLYIWWKNGTLLTPTTPQNWDMFMNDLNNTGYQNVTLTTQQISNWSFYTGGNVTSPAIVHNGIAYFTTVNNNGGYLYAIYLSNGSKLWNIVDADTISQSPTYYNGVVYFVGDSGGIYAINASTGNIIYPQSDIFRPTISETSESPIIIYNNQMFITGQTGDIMSFDLNGNELWSTSLGVNIFYSTPVIYNNIVYVGDYYDLNTSNIGLYALYSNNGSVLWHLVGTSSIASSPLLYNNSVYFGDTGGKFYRLGTNGSILFDISLTSNSIIKSSPTYNNNSIYIGDSKGNVYDINANNGSVNWQYTISNGNIESSPTISNGEVWIEDYNSGVVYALSSNNGSVLWNYTTNSNLESSVIIVNQSILFGGDDSYFREFTFSYLPFNQNIISNVNNQTIFTTTLTYGQYYWNVLSSDKAGNVNFNATNYSLQINPPVAVNLYSPITNTYINNPLQTFTANLTSLYNLTSANLYVWNSNGSLVYSNFYGECFQQSPSTPNLSTNYFTSTLIGSDGMCGERYTDAPATVGLWSNLSCVEGGDWNKYGEVQYTSLGNSSYIYTIYEIPFGALNNNSYWVIKANNITNANSTGLVYSYDSEINLTNGTFISQSLNPSINISIPSQCWNYSNNLVQFRIWSWLGATKVLNLQGSGTMFSCFDGNNWVELAYVNGIELSSLTQAFQQVYPNAMWWGSNNTNTLTGQSNTSITNFTLPYSGTFYWNVLGTDNQSNNDFAFNNNTLTYSNIPPQVTILFPLSQYYNYYQNIPLNYTVSSITPINFSFYNILNSENQVITANTPITTNTTITLPATTDTYRLTLCSVDVTGNVGCSIDVFGVTTTVPAVDLITPSNGQSFASGSNINFIFNASSSIATNLSTCIFYNDFSGNWGSAQTFSNINANTIQEIIPQNINDYKTHVWNVWCNDTAGRSSYALQNFSVSVINPVPPTQAGSGGAVTTNVTSITAWTMTTDSGQSSYTIYKNPGSPTPLGLFFQNMNTIPYSISLQCNDTEGSLCGNGNVIFSNQTFTLPVQQGIKTSTAFTISFPSTDTGANEEVFNILAKDQYSGSNVLTVIILGNGVISQTFGKIGAKCTLITLPFSTTSYCLSYLPIFFLLWIILSVILYYSIFKHVSKKNPVGWSIAIGFLLSILIIYFI